MFELVAGGLEKFQSKPFAVNYINISKPLLHSTEAVKKMMASTKSSEHELNGRRYNVTCRNYSKGYPHIRQDLHGCLVELLEMIWGK